MVKPPEASNSTNLGLKGQREGTWHELYSWERIFLSGIMVLGRKMLPLPEPSPMGSSSRGKKDLEFSLFLPSDLLTGTWVACSIEMGLSGLKTGQKRVENESGGTMENNLYSFL